MNFLGHLYFSNDNTQLMYANLFGDFVKGKDLSKYPNLIQSGILLHREIDSYIDHHPIVIELLHHLYPLLPKVSGIAVDLYFDHLLAKNWESYHQTIYKDFVQRFYDSQIDNQVGYSKEFVQFMGILKERDWISHYPTFDGLTKACQGLSSRISFQNTLGGAPDVYLANESLIEKTFEHFMDEAIVHFKDYHAQLQL